MTDRELKREMKYEHEMPYGGGPGCIDLTDRQKAELENPDLEQEKEE